MKCRDADSSLKLSLWHPQRSLELLALILTRPTSFVSAWHTEAPRKRRESIILLLHIWMWAHVFLWQIGLLTWSLWTNATILDFNAVLFVILRLSLGATVAIPLMMFPFFIVLAVIKWRMRRETPHGYKLCAIATLIFLGSISSFGGAFCPQFLISAAMSATVAYSFRVWYPLRQYIPALLFHSGLWLQIFALTVMVLYPFLHRLGLNLEGCSSDWRNSFLIVSTWLVVQYCIDQKILHWAILKSEPHPECYRWHPLYLFDYCPGTFSNIEKILVPFAREHPEEFLRESARLTNYAPQLEPTLARVKELATSSQQKPTDQYEARPPLRNTFVGCLLLVVGLIWGALATAPVVILVFFKNSEPRTWMLQELRDRPVIVVTIFIATFAIRWLHITPVAVIRTSVSLLSRDAKELVAKRTKPLVLYLRAFNEDSRSLSTEASIEESLSTVLSSSGLGQMVAIGRPGELLQTAGASRVYVGSDWQERVRELMDSAKLVVLRVGSSEGVWWEVTEALERVEPPRLLIWIPGDAAERSRLRQCLESKSCRATPVAFADGEFLWFNSTGEPRILSNTDDFKLLFPFRIEYDLVYISRDLNNLKHNVSEQERLKDLLSPVLCELGARRAESRIHSGRAGLLTAVWTPALLITCIWIGPVTVLLRLGEYSNRLVYPLLLYLGTFFIALLYCLFASNTSFAKWVRLLSRVGVFAVNSVLQLGRSIRKRAGDSDPTIADSFRMGSCVLLIPVILLLILMYVAMFKLNNQQRLKLAECSRLKHSESYVEAREAYNDYVKHWPNDADGWLGLAQMNLRTGLQAETKASIQRAIQLLRVRYPFDANVWETVGDTWYDVDSSELASQAYQCAIKANSNDLSVYYRLATLHEKQNELAQALAVLDQGLKLKDVSKNASFRAQSMLTRGKLLVRLGRLEESLLQFRELTVSDSYYSRLANLEIDSIRLQLKMSRE